jgi:hypothetical protein
MKKNIQPLFVLSLLLLSMLTACTNYGKKVKVDGTKAEVFYKGEGVTEADAKKVGDFLKDEGFLTKDKGASIQITKEGEAYVVRFVYNKEYYDKTVGLENVFKQYGIKMSKQIFDGKKVTIALADNKFSDFKTIPFDEVAAKTPETPAAPGNEVGNLTKGDFDHDKEGGVSFYWKDVSDNESKRIADYIVKNGAFANGAAEIYITMDGDRCILRFPVREEYRNDPAAIAELQKVSKEIKDNLFPNSPYSFQMTDERLNALKSFDY